MATTLTMCSRTVRYLYNSNVLQINRGVFTRLSQRTNLSTTSPEVNSSTTKDKATQDNKPDAEKLDNKSEQHVKFTEEIEKLQKQISDLQDKYKRSIAETENVRKRMKNQIADTKLFGIQGFCKDLLEVADILGKATESVPHDLITDQNPHLKGLYDGLNMTESQLHKVFNSHGLYQICPEEGEKFDPNVHEALFQQPASGKEEDTVANITKIGYKLHSRTLRPALVGVYK